MHMYICIIIIYIYIHTYRSKEAVHVRPWHGCPVRFSRFPFSRFGITLALLCFTPSVTPTLRFENSVFRFGGHAKRQTICIILGAARSRAHRRRSTANAASCAYDIMIYTINTYMYIYIYIYIHIILYTILYHVILDHATD